MIIDTSTGISEKCVGIIMRNRESINDVLRKYYVHSRRHARGQRQAVLWPRGDMVSRRL